MPSSTAPILHSTPCQVRVQSAPNTLKSSELHLLQAELGDNLFPNVDFEVFVRNVLKLSKVNYETLTSSYIAKHLGSSHDWDRYLALVASSGGEPAIYDPLIELVHWIHNQLEMQLGWQPGANLRFRNTWSRALDGSTASRKPDITGVTDSPHTSHPDWKEALVVWEVKHKSPRPFPDSQELTFAHLSPTTSAPRPFVSDQSGLAPVSKKRAALAESLPLPPRKKSKSTSTSRNDPDTALESGQIRKPETPLEQLLSYTLETMVAQPHRRHTIGLLLHDFGLQLVFHCRGFVVTSEPFDIREHRDRLIIVIAALWIADLETLGFEKRFIGPGGRPALDPIGSSVSIGDMELKIERALYKARALFGRGSAALVGADKKNPTALYVIKISCQAKTREPEAAFLKAATDIPNIIRLVCSANWGCMLEGFGEDFLRSIGQFEAREFRVLVLSPVCELITTIDDLSVFKTCFIKLMKAHRALFEEHVLHCDISIWNLMYDPITQEPYLIDADLGKSIDKLGAPSSNHRTGTLPFMAVDLLVHKPPPHMYRHDLESFFYVLVWICAEDHLGWHRVDSVVRMAEKKSYFLHTFDIAELRVEKFPELKTSWITGIHRMFRAGAASRLMWETDPQTFSFDEETLNGRVTYEKILENITA